MLHRSLLQPAEVVAPRLLGCEILRTLANGTVLRGKIVETEAYDQADPASHSYRGPTPRTRAMFGPPGYAYVYGIYGMHCCLNVVCGPAGRGAAVLIRAVQPVEGEAIMATSRNGLSGPSVTNGPAKLCYALQVDKQFDGHDFWQPPLQLRLRPPLATADIVHTTRIGIRYAVQRPWRFYIRYNPYVSRE